MLAVITYRRSQKILQDVIRLILEAYYEPQFSEHSHGFRPQRGCHTALRTIARTWNGMTWFIEGDISAYFDSIDHTVLREIIREKIHDNRFLRLLDNLLKAGYLEDWRFNKTLSGTPQGGVVTLPTMLQKMS
jgi:retron-type reverse transcriptase